MGGIYGLVSGSRPDTGDLRRMSQALAHRGPDDRGVFLSEQAALGNRRLAIIDIERGRQPLSNVAGTIEVVLDGTIFNYRQLRRRLEGAGRVFRTGSDTEVILQLYEELGEQCVRELRGMFAFALWDQSRRRLILARDHLGQKPLHFLQDGETLLFASEPKALLAVRPAARAIDLESLHHYLSLRFLPAPRTMLRQIRKLPPAHLLVYQDGRIELSRYWDLSFREKLEQSDATLLAGLREKLHETVAINNVGDVPIGAFLSGGLDSSLLVAMMAKDASRTFATFTVGSDDPRFDERPYARLVSRQFGTRWVETTARTDLVDLLPLIVWHLDEPSDAVAAGKFIAARLAATQVKAVLGGDGGDELFAGFDRYFGVALIDRLSPIAALLGRLSRPVIDQLPASFGYWSLVQNLRWALRVSGASGIGQRFAEAVGFFRFSHTDKRELFTDEAWRLVAEVPSGELLESVVANSDATDPIERMLHADYLMRLPEHSLMLTDRVGMAHGVEIRSPLVDHELVSYVASFPTRLKVRGHRRKYIARKLGEVELPPAIARRRKAGFRVPLAAWFAGELYPFLGRVLGESRLVEAGIFKPGCMKQLLEQHHARRDDHSIRLWMLLNLEIWYRLVIDQLEPDAVSHWLRGLR